MNYLASTQLKTLEGIMRKHEHVSSKRRLKEKDIGERLKRKRISIDKPDFDIFSIIPEYSFKRQKHS